MQRQEYPDGSVYEGVWVDGKRHGEGKYTYAVGAVYDGAWHDDKRHGQGKYTYANGVYEGEWRDDKKDGHGKRTYASGGVYEGAWVNDKWHGQGKYTYINGAVYEGQWHDGKKHGQGKHTYADSAVYEGEWVDGKRHGEGEYTLANGAVWRGVCDMGTPTLAEMRAAAQLPAAAPVDRAVDTSAPTHPAERHTPEGADGGGEAGDDTESPPRKKRKRASKWTRRKASRQTAGGSGVMEGEQEFDYGEVTRRCLPPGPRHCPDGARLEEHRKALCVGTPPPAILYTDEASCALDSFNMGVGYAAISRADLEGDAEACPHAAPAKPFGAGGEAPPSSLSTIVPGGASACGVDGGPKAVNLGHARVVAAMKRAGFVLHPIGGKKAVPTLQRVLKQRRGVFLVEFYWVNSEGESAHHVVAVNCDLRLIFCNTLGALPFTLAGDEWLERESDATHVNVARRFRVRGITRVWRILRA